MIMAIDSLLKGIVSGEARSEKKVIELFGLLR
jgi:hypothetical protein